MTARFDVSEALGLAKEWAREAGGLLCREWGKAHRIEHKGRIDLVTEVDIQSEEMIVGRIRAAFPDHAIVAEEGGGGPKGEGFTWYIDPLDGTNNFAHGHPVFCVSLALASGEEPLLGVIFDPLRKELFAAQRGGGATLNGEPLHVSSIATMEAALAATGFPYARREGPITNIPEFAALLMACQGIRRAGSAALDLAYVAAGRLDLYWEQLLNPWDMAAGALLIQEAGGQATDIEGRVNLLDGRYIVTSNGLLHQQTLDLLREAGASLPHTNERES